VKITETMWHGVVCIHIVATETAAATVVVYSCHASVMTDEGWWLSWSHVGQGEHGIAGRYGRANALGGSLSDSGDGVHGAHGHVEGEGAVGAHGNVGLPLEHWRVRGVVLEVGEPARYAGGQCGAAVCRLACRGDMNAGGDDSIDSRHTAQADAHRLRKGGMYSRSGSGKQTNRPHGRRWVWGTNGQRAAAAADSRASLQQTSRTRQLGKRHCPWTWRG